jgi:hypothetical protein
MQGNDETSTPPYCSLLQHVSCRGDQPYATEINKFNIVGLNEVRYDLRCPLFNSIKLTPIASTSKYLSVTYFNVESSPCVRHLVLVGDFPPIVAAKEFNKNRAVASWSEQVVMLIRESAITVKTTGKLAAVEYCVGAHNHHPSHKHAKIMRCAAIGKKAFKGD